MAFKISGSTIIDDNRGFKSYSDTLYSLGNTGANPNIDLSNGNFVIATLNQTATFTFSNSSTGAFAFTLVLTNGSGGPFTITWPASVKWPNETIPTRTTTASKTDVYTFFTYDSGTTWWGQLSLYNFS